MQKLEIIYSHAGLGPYFFTVFATLLILGFDKMAVILKPHTPQFVIGNAIFT